MRQLLFYFVIVLFSHHSLVYCQENDFKIFTNRSLGIQFKYRDADDFDDEKRVSTPYPKWIEVNIPQLKLEVTIPSGFVVETEKATLVKIVYVDDKQTNKFTAIQIYLSELSFPQIAEEHNFVLVDSLGDIIWLNEGNPSQIKWAIANNSWASLGRQNMTEDANALNGISWKGVRGSNFTGSYNENGYAGLQRCTSSFITYSIDNKNRLVCDYSDTQLDPNPMSESEFYDVVASIKFLQK